MTTSRQRWRQCRSMGVPWLFAGRAANQTNNLLRLHGALYSHLPPPAAPCPTHPRTARRARLARGSPRLSMPHSYSIFLVNNKIKVQMGVSLALFLFLCVNWFTACVGGRRRRRRLLLLLLRMAGRPWCRLLPHCSLNTEFGRLTVTIVG